VLVVALLGVALLMRRPTRGDDSDRFTKARRITTSWAADAGTDMVHPTPGQPGTVDTSPEATDPPEVPDAAPSPRVAEVPRPSESPETMDLRGQTPRRPTRRPPRA